MNSTPWLRASCNARARRGWAISRPSFSPTSRTVTLRPRSARYSASSTPTSPPPTTTTRLPIGIQRFDIDRTRSMLDMKPSDRPIDTMMRRWNGSRAAAVGSSPVRSARRSSPENTCGSSAPGTLGRSRRAPVATMTTSALSSRNNDAVTGVDVRTSTSRRLISVVR
ncbi:unannotated protein [freshwater metagenome]|uniref:Unannotated protein n=1 Tax=freshwater metagenome TaxID=449393 RepID=A0A6J7HIB7_9ZZZZ